MPSNLTAAVLERRTSTFGAPGDQCQMLQRLGWVITDLLCTGQVIVPSGISPIVYLILREVKGAFV